MLKHLFTSSLVVAAFGLTGPQAQIKFKNAFPGITFSKPVYFGQMPGRAGKTFVVLEQHDGRVNVLTQNNGTWTKSTLFEMAVNQANEMGLLGIAFHPDYKNNHKYYITYNTPTDFNDVLEERIADSSLIKDSGTKGRVLLSLVDKYENHNGGTIAFGPKDHYLYYGMGDGGSGGDPDGNGQNKNVLFAKMMRLDVDTKATGKAYGIPSDNPFAGGGGSPEIYAYGLRNPWKWSFDDLTGTLWVGDVGQDATEEVDTLTKGGNYGWNKMEGPSGTNDGSMILPLFSYPHTTGHCVIGGRVYRGNPASKYYGTYFLAEFTDQKFWMMQKDNTGKFVTTDLGATPTQFSSFGVDDAGQIYVTGLYTGIIYVLDDPDLGPSPAGLRSEWTPEKRHGYVTVNRSEPLPAFLFEQADGLDLMSPEGRTLLTITRKTPVLPGSFPAGIYLAKHTGSKSAPRMLLLK